MAAQRLPVRRSGRYSDAGHLLQGSRGAHGCGYALCLRCGRTASETGPTDETAEPNVVGLATCGCAAA